VRPCDLHECGRAAASAQVCGAGAAVRRMAPERRHTMTEARTESAATPLTAVAALMINSSPVRFLP